MKKILLFFILLACIIGYFHREVFNYVENIIHKYTNIKKDVSVVATVNGYEIKLEEIEALYDIRYAFKSTFSSTVKELQTEYAQIIYNRIEQILAEQEIEKRQISFDEEKVNILENSVRESYDGLEPISQEEFISMLEKNGINYQLWKNQLKNNLLIDELRHDLSKTIVNESSEIDTYLMENPEIAIIPKLFDFYILKSSNKEDLVKIALEKKVDLTIFENPKISVEQGIFTTDQLPEKYAAIITELKEKTFSKIRDEEHLFYTIYMNQIKPEKKLDALEIYAIADKKIKDKKIPQIYQDWLLQTISNSKIFITKEFNLKNIQMEDQKDLFTLIQKNMEENEDQGE